MVQAQVEHIMIYFHLNIFWVAKVVKKNHSLLNNQTSKYYFYEIHSFLSSFNKHHYPWCQVWYSMSTRTCFCIPSIHIKKLSMTVHICSVNTGRRGQEDPRGSLVSQSSQLESSKISESPSEQKYGRGSNKGRHPKWSPGLHMHI